MPDIKARPWFTRVAKMFGQNLSSTDIVAHAAGIGLTNPSELLGCIRDSGTDTARQIIRALYSKERLRNESGTEAVSRQRRQAIRGKYNHIILYVLKYNIKILIQSLKCFQYV